MKLPKLRCHGTYGLILFILGWIYGGTELWEHDVVSWTLLVTGSALVLHHLARYYRTHD